MEFSAIGRKSCRSLWALDITIRRRRARPYEYETGTADRAKYDASPELHS